MLSLLGAARRGAGRPAAVAPQQDLNSVRKEISTLQQDIARKEAERQTAGEIAKSEQALQATHQVLNERRRSRMPAAAS
jgi:hypothetical protein